jgi:ring-1,2-phenylacetyl-CoA epoxidase subunit PaaC
MSFDDAYEALTDHDDDTRWAYGTGFSDPMAGVPTEVPERVDRADLTAYCLMLGDDALIMSHRLQQWVTRAPELEDELAIANIGLDLLGQARLLLTRAGDAEGAGRGEDALAYLRDPHEFRHVALAQWEDADFAQLVARLLIFAAWRLAVFDRLSGSGDPVVAAIAAKGVKELAYHREYAAQWVVRLGDGTELSHDRMQAAIEAVWPLTAELFETHEIESRLVAAGVAVDPAAVRDEFVAVLAQVLDAAKLEHPADRKGGAGDHGGAPGAGDPGGAAGPGVGTGGAEAEDGVGPVLPPAEPADAVGSLRGRSGEHGSELVAVLEEMQGLARAMPGSTW